ncbi:2-C-methyl-D-erythritol 4-phosphate cytidylyltransferase [Anthocerotibacter panamensis]|uniref:2-C-methyl-D-erythritol 4-phosphate cytidylyltransferase n=1 Tax=Anthocerotibacter panamensis TaxID=2857077 RepID=UPI001C402F9B|nr:2-C-methyl-D-erythritol 4-phosphate cytidylyltransferase [Anthocerotibacter panamensis]
MHLLIAAAGSGSRMGASRNKLLLPLLDRPLIAWTLDAVMQATTIDWVGMMVSRTDYPAFKALVAGLPIVLIEGGATRQASVAAGLAALPGGAEQVLIHDGARCLVTPDLIDRCAHALLSTPGLIAAVPVKDTIKEVASSTLQIQYTPPRERLWAAQTPQGFAVPLLKKAHQTALDEGWNVTDDAALFEKLDLPVTIVPGEETNLKVTTPLDLILARVILEQRLASKEP